MTVPLISSMLAGLLRRRLAYYKPVTSLLLAVIVAFPGYAQTIGNWTFTNTLTGTGSSFNTVGNISLGSAIPTNAFNGSTEWFGENGWPAGGVNTNAYIQFTITPNAGYELNLTDLVLRLRRSNTGSPAGSGPTQWSLRSSLDGFAADLSSNSLTHNYANYTVALNSSFHHLYTTITFRLYGYSVTIGSGGTSRLVVDNITVNGLTSVLALDPSGEKIVEPVRRPGAETITNPLIKFVSVSGQSLVTGIQVTDNGNYTLLLHAANGILIQRQPVHLQKGFSAITIPLINSSHGVITVSLYNGQCINSKKIIY